jgi:hypothetical protein
MVETNLTESKGRNECNGPNAMVETNLKHTKLKHKVSALTNYPSDGVLKLFSILRALGGQPPIGTIFQTKP